MAETEQYRSGVQLCTFNCRSVKNCLPDVMNLCRSHDLVLLQEHWLLPHELSLLNSIHPEFLSTGLSAVDVSSGILVGRPYGGTAILYRKSFGDKLSVLRSSESRITSVVIDTDNGPILIINVYMPTNYGDDESYEQYLDCLTKLEAIILETNCAHVMIAGDFNCDTNSRFYPELDSFMIEHRLMLSDKKRMKNVCTYISDDGSKHSWIDHVICTASVDSVISRMSVLDDVYVSDHKPVSCSIDCSVMVNYVNLTDTSVYSGQVPHWSACSDFVRHNYELCLDNLLKKVDVPVGIFSTLCVNSVISDECKNSIDKFYSDISECIKIAVSEVIPMRKCNFDSHFNIPGWNTYVKEKHDLAREAYLSWVQWRRPKSGYVFEYMRKTRAVFKLAVRYCKNNIEQMKADACAEGLIDNDCNKFWRNVHKMSNSRATNLANCVGGSVGAENITKMWKQHFDNLFNSGADSSHRLAFEAKLADKMIDISYSTFSVLDVITAVNSMKLGKCPGPDGLNMEAFHYGGKRLCILLCILFNMCMKYGYVPGPVRSAIMVPLLKCKTGDISDVDNYRAITLSNSVSKILESLLLDIIVTVDGIDDYQFGFQKGVSTALCTDVFKNTVEYYRRNGSHVFCCFIDFRKAFDRVDYWLLFSKLLESSGSQLCGAAARLLAFWYSHQQVAVRWQTTYSECFSIACGVRQGGILSPFLFKLYVRDLLKGVVRSRAGCNVAGHMINVLAYADDMVLIAPSWRGLQCLLEVIGKEAVNIDMLFNTNKTVCMYFNPYDKCKTVSNSFAQFSLAGISLSFVPMFKYLGHIIDNKLQDDADVCRELKCLFTRTNILIRRFSRCSSEVKIRLFRSFCVCFYDIALWRHVKVTVLNKLRSAYVKCMKMFFNFPKYSSVTDMLIRLGLPSFSTISHNAEWTFMKQSTLCNNRLVSIVRDICMYDTRHVSNT